jgi:hypothetical protein
MSRGWRRYGVLVTYLTVFAIAVGGLALDAYNARKERRRDDQSICTLARIQERTWSTIGMPNASGAAAAWRQVLADFHCGGTP